MHLLDANCFMEAARLYYAFDVAPNFWEWLAGDTLVGRVASVEAAREEILRGDDALAEWARAVRASFWLPVTDATLRAAAALSQWAIAPERGFTQAAVDGFFGEGADLLLVAEAMAGEHTVVTREVAEPNRKKSIKIPDACAAFDVPCAQPFPTYAALGLRLG